ncbi:MAG: N-acetylneuraminate synthase family protein [Agarilytica sp.]
MAIFDFKKLVEGGSPYVIAEIGSNHNGDMALAKKLIDAAKESGAHAAKFQSWTNKSLISRQEYEANQSYDDDPKKHFGSLEEMVDKYYLRTEQHLELKQYCDKIGIDFCSTPFSLTEVDMLDELDVPFFKVASMDINHLPLLRYIATKNKPVILSTGMAELSEIDEAIRLLEGLGIKEIAVLHCISIYPPKNEDIHLNNLTMLKQSFDYPVGLSDHSIGAAIPLASVALGSVIIEKHFTIDKGLEGWDHMISADPEEMKAICAGSKAIAESMGAHKRVVSQAEQEKRLKFRRSIVLSHAMKAGDVIQESDLDYKRPGTAIAPNESEFVIGRTLKTDLQEDALLQWDNLV